jgi:hypothetical protein
MFEEWRSLLLFLSFFLLMDMDMLVLDVLGLFQQALDGGDFV